MQCWWIVSWRKQWRALATGIALVCCIGSAWAATDPSIPSGFLAYPPYSGFVWEATHLLPNSTDNFLVVEGEDYTLLRSMDQVRDTRNPSGSYSEAKLKDEERAAQAKLTTVPAKFALEFKAMQSAASGDAAYQIGKGLPPAIRLYAAAAVDFHLAHPVIIERQPGFTWPKPPAQGPMDSRQVGTLGRAITRFQDVLDLSGPEKNPRAVAAAYMLGRSYSLRGLPGDVPKAEQAFVLTRTLVRAGLPDPDGLAVASFGEEARLKRAQGDLGAAVHLYAEQAAHGSVEGVESLKWVAQALYQDPRGMAKVEGLPLAQRLLIAYALEVNDDALVIKPIYTPSAETPQGIVAILATAKQWPAAKVAWPDRLAALAYRNGDFNFTRSLIVSQDTALAWWLRAKLLVADGNLPAAEAAFRKTVALTPGTSDEQGRLSPFNGAAACYELAQLERTRGEFVHSLGDLVACDKKYGVGQFALGWQLGNYLAERVLTTEELQRFVDTLPVPRPKDPSEFVYSTDHLELHFELAQRLAREDRFKRAIRYADNTIPVDFPGENLSFDTGLSEKLKTQKDLIHAYATAYGQSRHAMTRVARAAAWYELALLTRVHYPRILGHNSPLYEEEAEPLFPGVSRSELDRLKENYTTPDQDNLHWYIAYDDAMKAAALVPARSQAYAAILCHAAHWMYQAPPIGGRKPQEIFKATYHLYLKNGAYVAWGKAFGHQCPDPNFVDAAQPAWRRTLTSYRYRVHRHRVLSYAVIAVLALGFIVIVAWLVSRPMRRQTK